jgi:hypothetical protein
MSENYIFYPSYLHNCRLPACAVTVLLVNLLIAMMGNTYSEIASIKNEWMRQVPWLFLFLPDMRAKSSQNKHVIGSILNVFLR